MKFKVTDSENISTVFLNGEIDMDIADDVREVIFPLIDSGKEVHLNLKDVQYMDSSGISVIVESSKRAKDKIAADKLKQEAIDFKTALTTIGRFTIKKQVGEDGVLFGTVTNGDVAEAIQTATKKAIDRRNITVPDIHSLGSFVAKIKLHQEVNAEVNIEVTS